MKLKHVLIIIVLIPMFLSCAKIKSIFTGHKRLTRGRDYEAQYKRGVEYYNKKDYGRALALFENVQNAYAGKEQIDTILFYTADCHFKRNNFHLSADLFDQYRTNMGRSSFAIDADFRYALSLYHVSPDTELDQSFSRKAIYAFEDFIYRNPDNENVPKAEEYLKELHDRVYKNEVEVAKTYFDIGYYNSAITYLNSILRRIPDIPYREDVLFFLVHANYEYARSSVPSKQKERFYNMIDAYYSFVSEYPESKHLGKAKKLHKDASAVATGGAEVNEITSNVVHKNKGIEKDFEKVKLKLEKAKASGASRKKIEKLQLEYDLLEKTINVMRDLEKKHLR